jgi:hypothetical protein
MGFAQPATAVTDVGSGNYVAPDSPSSYSFDAATLSESEYGSQYAPLDDLARPSSGCTSYNPNCIPDTVYAACGINDSSTKLVTDQFYHGMELPPMTHLYSTLRCGTDRWGFNHIRDNHASQYQDKANLINRNWRDLFDWTTRIALEDPDRTTWQHDNDAWCYDREFKFENLKTGEVLMKTRVRVVVNSDGDRIRTAWPTSKSRCTGVVQ